MMVRAVLTMFVLMVGVALGATPKVPVLAIDTLPPRVTVKPAPGWYSSPVTVRFETSENAAVYAGINGAVPSPVNGPISLLSNGESRVRFYAEDDFGNRSLIDSVYYGVDISVPRITVDPPSPLVSPVPITVRVRSDEPVRVLRHERPDCSDTVAWRDTFTIAGSFSGFLSVVDRAGHIATSPLLSYVIDTSRLDIRPAPLPGTYNTPVTVSFVPPESVTIFWSYSAIAGPEQFNLYIAPFDLPAGQVRLRYYARRGAVRQTAVREAAYLIDTVAPRLKGELRSGPQVDTIVFDARESAEIRYVRTGNPFTFDAGTLYSEPVVVPHVGRAFFAAAARDAAGNISRRVVVEKRYDTIPPVITPSMPSGTYDHVFLLSFTASERAQIYYTVDGSEPSERSKLYANAIPLTAQGRVEIRAVGIDEAGNVSAECRLDYKIDRTPPVVKFRINGNPAADAFSVVFTPDEECDIRYALGNATLDESSPLYRGPIPVHAGQLVRYFAVDRAGNSTGELVLRELTRPIAAVEPDGGTFNTPQSLRFSASLSAAVYARVLPDTVFTLVDKTIELTGDGDYVVEYYALTDDGGRTSVKRGVYHIDHTPPQVKISVRKGVGDSVVVFFDCSENADIYYTLDGSDPSSSRRMRIAGNRFSLSHDRIVVKRTDESRLSFYAEDAAQNRGATSVMDIFRPAVIAGVPSGISRIHDRIVSISLNTYDERAQIRFEQHGRTPTPYSTLYSEPITLTASDTIKAFVIDASGYRGPVETFIYMIDLPPIPVFSISPDTGVAGRPMAFNGTATHDAESSQKECVFTWDFNGDGVMDQTVKGLPTASYTYPKPGIYQALLEVTDGRGRKSTTVYPVAVRAWCPDAMVSVPRDSGRSFCIDKKRSSSRQGEGWIDAFMTCRDRGLRLCSLDEWEYACGGSHGDAYPYGRTYAAEKSRSPCPSVFGAFDMVGGTGEWTASKEAGRAAVAGAGVGSDAKCSSVTREGIAQTGGETGYRCCR